MATKAELEARVAELEAEVSDLQEKLGAEELNGEAIAECRGYLAEVGHRATFFDDAVLAAVHEIRALRYDRSQYVRLMSQSWSYRPEDPKKQRAKRDGTEPQAWVMTMTRP